MPLQRIATPELNYENIFQPMAMLPHTCISGPEQTVVTVDQNKESTVIHFPLLIQRFGPKMPPPESFPETPGQRAISISKSLHRCCMECVHRLGSVLWLEKMQASRSNFTSNSIYCIETARLNDSQGPNSKSNIPRSRPVCLLCCSSKFLYYPYGNYPICTVLQFSFHGHLIAYTGPHVLTPAGWLSQNAVEDRRLEPGETIQQLHTKLQGKLESAAYFPTIEIEPTTTISPGIPKKIRGAPKFAEQCQVQIRAVSNKGSKVGSF